MRRGEIWWLLTASATGGETQKRRPAVIISNNAANQYANRVQVLPVSSQVTKLYPCETLISILGMPSKVMADQVTTAAKERLQAYICALSAEELQRVEQVVRLQLGL